MSRLEVIVDMWAPRAAVVRLLGEFGHELADTVSARLRRLEATDVETIFIDLRRLEFLDSGGLSCLLAPRRRAARVERRLVLVRSEGRVARVMLMAGLQDAFEFVDRLPATPMPSRSAVETV